MAELLVGSTRNHDWLNSAANTLQVLIGVLCGHQSLEAFHQVSAQLPEPRDESERLMFRGLMCEVLLDAVSFGRGPVQRDALAALLREWPALRQHPQPVAALRHV